MTECAMASIAIGCGPSLLPPDANRTVTDTIPAWVLKTPVESGRVYAVGAVGRVIFPQVAREKASDAARKELAKSLQSHVESVILVIQRSNNRSTVSEAFVVEATSVATNAVTDNATVVAIWTDLNNIVPNGDPEATYALAMIQVEGLPKRLGETAKKFLPPEQVEAFQNQAKKTFGK